MLCIIAEFIWVNNCSTTSVFTAGLNTLEENEWEDYLMMCFKLRHWKSSSWFKFTCSGGACHCCFMLCKIPVIGVKADKWQMSLKPFYIPEVYKKRDWLILMQGVELSPGMWVKVVGGSLGLWPSPASRHRACQGQGLLRCKCSWSLQCCKA